MSGNKFELINTLCESKMFRNKQAMIRFDAEMTKDAFFLYMLGLYVLSQDDSTAEWSAMYATRTITFNNFDHFRTSGTDFYMLAYMLTGSDKEFGKVDVEMIYRKSNLNITLFKQFLRNIAKSVDIDHSAGQYFMRVERELGIRDGRYRSLRRQISNWDNITDSAKKVAIKHLFTYIKLIDVKAEILPELKKSKGGFALDDLTTRQKVAVAAGVAVGGFAIGYAAARKNPK